MPASIFRSNRRRLVRLRLQRGERESYSFILDCEQKERSNKIPFLPSGERDRPSVTTTRHSLKERTSFSSFSISLKRRVRVWEKQDLLLFPHETPQQHLIRLYISLLIPSFSTQHQTTTSSCQSSLSTPRNCSGSP